MVRNITRAAVCILMLAAIVVLGNIATGTRSAKADDPVSYRAAVTYGTPVTETNGDIVITGTFSVAYNEDSYIDIPDAYISIVEHDSMEMAESEPNEDTDGYHYTEYICCAEACRGAEGLAFFMASTGHGNMIMTFAPYPWDPDISVYFDPPYTVSSRFATYLMTVGALGRDWWPEQFEIRGVGSGSPDADLYTAWCY